MFDWMYDEDAPRPSEKILKLVKKATGAAKASPTCQTTAKFARAGVYVGAFVGAIVLIGGISQMLNRVVLGNKQ
jgi:hypothetical protein